MNDEIMSKKKRKKNEQTTSVGSNSQIDDEDRKRMRRGQGLLGVTDADFCCGMRWPGDATGLSNRSSTSSNDPKNQYKNQNNNHYTSHQHLRTHLRGPSFSAFTSLVISSREIIKNHHDSFIRPDPFSLLAPDIVHALAFSSTCSWMRGKSWTI